MSHIVRTLEWSMFHQYANSILSIVTFFVVRKAEDGVFLLLRPISVFLPLLCVFCHFPVSSVRRGRRLLPLGAAGDAAALALVGGLLHHCCRCLSLLAVSAVLGLVLVVAGVVLSLPKVPPGLLVEHFGPTCV